MPTPATFADLEVALRELGAKLGAREVHALYLGALTCTRRDAGPHLLLGRIFGSDHTVVESGDDLGRHLPVLFGYWNTLVEARDEGRVGLAEVDLPERVTRRDLMVRARRREEELTWYVRGLDACGSGPEDLGPEGKRLLTGIAQGAGHLTSFVGMLERRPGATARELAQCRTMLLGMEDTLATILRQLLDLGEAMRSGRGPVMH
jgi:hypothetical protein